MTFDRRLLQQLTAARAQFALTVLLGVCAGWLVIAQASLLSRIIARVFLAGATLEGVWNLLFVLLAIIAVRALLAWASDVSAFRIAARVKTDLRVRVFNHLMALGPVYLRGERAGELVNTAVEGIESLEAYYSQYLPQLVLAALVPLSILVFVFPVDLLSGLVLLITGPLIPFFMILIGKAADALARKQYADLSVMSAHFLDVLQGLATLKMFGKSRHQIETIRRVSERFRDATLSILRVTFLSAFALEMIATISTAIVAVEIGLRLLYGQVQFEQAFFVLVLAPDFYLPLRLLGTRFHMGMSGLAAGARIFEILETPALNSSTTKSGAVGHIRSGGEYHGSKGPGGDTRNCPNASVPSVTFHNVHYAYADDRPALRGVSFSIAAGRHLALVGPTGAGKSTIVSLLLGFIEPSRGEIMVGGVGLQEVPGLRIVWVPQNPYLFNESVAENIRLGRPKASMDEVIAAAQSAYADEFIRALPQGYATVAGERGARLSAGQAQRIALARAFLASEDASLLILDEATLNLDAETEAHIQDAIERLLLGRTALIIAHRLKNIARADQIVVLENGRVAETGTHQTLMQMGGAYYRLVAAASDEQCGICHYEERSLQRLLHRPPEPPELADPEWSSQTTSGASGMWGAGAEGQVSNLAVQSGLVRGDYTERSELARNPPHTISRLLRLAAPFKWWIALAALFGSLTISSSIGLMATSAFILAGAALHPSIADLAVPIVGVRFFGIARGVFRYLERYLSHYVNLSLLARLRVWFYSAVEPLAPARLMNYRSGDLLSRIVGDIETLQNFYVRVLAPPLVALFIAALMVVFLSGFSASLAFVILLFMIWVGIALPAMARRSSRGLGPSLVDFRSRLNAQLVDAFQGIADVIAFGRVQTQIALVDSSSRELVRLQARMASLTGMYSAAGNFLVYAAVWSTLLIAIPLVAGGQLNGVYLPVLALAVLSSFEGASSLPLAFQYLETNLQAAHRLFEIADARTGGNMTTTSEESPRLVPGPSPSISFDNVSFRYLADEPLALDGVSFELSAGSRLAIVGPSGAGKSTIVNLLLRFWDTEAGHISIAGRYLKGYALEQARAFFTVAPQPTHLFNASIRDNLLLAKPAATDAELMYATKVAQVHDFIAALPQAYATRVGEQGLRLSGGERQRLAIARALLSDAPILLLDEPSANLDPITEREMLTALLATMKRRTLLMITHRLVELEAFDEILVLQAGRVVERGTHGGLLKKCGLYRRMWDLQSQ